MRAFYVAFLLTFASPSLRAQDLPLEVPKIGLPKSAVCTVCRSERRADSERKVAVGLRYHSKVYYFCSHREADRFKRSPEDFISSTSLPRPAPILRA